MLFFARLAKVAIIPLLCGLIFSGIALSVRGEDKGDNKNQGDTKGEKKDSKNDAKGDTKKEDRQSDNKGDKGSRNGSDRGGATLDRDTTQRSSKGNSESGSPSESSRRGANPTKNNDSRSVDKVRSDWHDRDRDKLPFRAGWWDNNRFGRLPAYNPLSSKNWRDRPYYWWRPATADRISGWVVYRWKQPAYWDYGRDSYIYIEKDAVYRDGKRYKTIDAYYNEIYKLAHSAPIISDEEAGDMEWMPLGVFAIVNKNGDDSGRVLQLAVRKKGIIAGAYFTKQEDRAHPIQGMVDENTQTAAWVLADGSSKDLVMETSIYNLTKPQCTIMVHSGPTKAEVWQLVRLEEPESSGTRR